MFPVWEAAVKECQHILKKNESLPSNTLRSSMLKELIKFILGLFAYVDLILPLWVIQFKFVAVDLPFIKPCWWSHIWTLTA